MKWSKVNIPAEGGSGKWALAYGSDVQHLTMATDGTLYAYANPSGTAYTLFKSTDAGYSWSYTGKVTDSIIDIATAPDDASIVYYATSSNVYKSTNAGTTFNQLLPNPGGSGGNNIEITSIDVARLNGKSIVIVSTTDTDASQYGGVYLLDESLVVPAWTDTDIGNYDAYAVAASPDFATDQRLIAVVSDEKKTFVTSNIAGGDWDISTGNAIIPVAIVATADIAFPSDYDATTDYALFVAIDTGTDNDGDVYLIDSAAAPANSIATDLDIGSRYGLDNVDATTLAVGGNTATAYLMAGAADSTQVYFSSDGGKNWTRSTKEPSGQSRTSVLMAADFTSSRRAYAATIGTESALSMTQDGGVTWNQIGLIDTRITNIIDRKSSPNYGQDKALFILTSGEERSLWRSTDGGVTWERIFTSALPGVDTITLVGLPPRYGSGTNVLFLAGTGGGKSSIWKSTDNGQNFVRQTTHDPTRTLATDTSFGIDTWAVVDDNTLFIGSFNGTNGLVYYTADSGWTYSTGAKAGKKPLNTILLSPDYERDKTILVSNTDGWVYWSDDNGASFEPLPPRASKAPFTRFVNIAFDLEFSDSRTVYANSGAADKYLDVYKGIYRFVVNQSTKWVFTLATTAPTLVGPAQDFPVKFNLITGTTAPVNLTWQKPSDEVAKYELWLALDDTFEQVIKVITIEETVNPVILSVGPGADIPFNFLPNTTYFWRVRTFSDLPFECEWSETRRFTVGKLEATLPIILETPPPPQITIEYPPVVIIIPAPSLSTPLPPTTTPPYLLWIIIGIGGVLVISWAMLTRLGSKVTAPQFQPEAAVPQLQSPKDGAVRVQLKPLFQWSAVASTDRYELLVSTNPSLANPTIVKTGAYALVGTAWQCNVSLNHNTTYYWKVSATVSDTWSDWSAISTFTTKPLPAISSLIPGHRH